MSIKVFYSWQSDISSGINRNFIEDVLEKAIKKLSADVEIQEALRDEDIVVDKDTKNIPGTPPIVETIFKKISKCGIFVPDLTFVGKSKEGRLLPNPNVLIEYGWALRELSYTRIVPVMNIAFGDPTPENMPFDMRHLRNPLTYRLANGVDEKERAKTKTDLITNFLNAFDLIIRSGVLEKHDEKKKEFEGMATTSRPSIFFQTDETFETTRAPKELKIPDVQHLFLRLIPRVPFSNISTSKGALDLARSGQLNAMGEDPPGCSYERNRHGAFAYHQEKGQIANFTQLFKTGEIWGIDTECIDKDLLVSGKEVDFGYFPCVSVENSFTRTLVNYIRFARDFLKIPLPMKFIAGATDVKGYRMTAPPGMSFSYERFAGRVVEEHIVFEGMITDYSKQAHTVLRPFFEHVWEECGLTRPDKDVL
jgi:hypothetical protein